HLRDLHLEEVIEGLLDLVPGRLTTHQQLEPVPVLQILGRGALQHVQRLLCDIRMEENLVRLHGDQLRSTSRAPSLNIVSRPGSPPGARTSAFNPAGLTTSTPGRFPKSRRTFAGSFTTTSRLRGCRYRRPRIFPRPARTWRPSFARSTSAYTPRRSRILTPSWVAPPSGWRVSIPSSITTGRLSSSLNSCPRAETIVTSFTTSPSREYTCTRPPSRGRTSALASFAFAAFAAFEAFSGSAAFLRRIRGFLPGSAGASDADFFDSGRSLTLPVSIRARRR